MCLESKQIPKLLKFYNTKVKNLQWMHVPVCKINHRTEHRYYYRPSSYSYTKVYHVKQGLTANYITNHAVSYKQLSYSRAIGYHLSHDTIRVIRLAVVKRNSANLQTLRL